MIIVHNLNHSRSIRILWLLEELGLDYEIKQYERGSDGLAPDAYKKLHPIGKAPIVTDGEDVLIESGAVIETLLDRHGNGRLQPEPGSKDWIQYRYWMHAAEGSLMSQLLLKLILDRMESKTPFFMRPVVSLVTGKVKSMYVNPNLKDFFTYTNDVLAKSTWLTGETFTAADIMMGFPGQAAMKRADGAGRYPHIQAWIQKWEKRPAYQRALQKNGPFQIMG